MAVDMEDVKAALYPEELDYPKVAQQLGAAALPHLEKIIGGSDASLAAKAAYLAGLIGGEQSAPAVAKAARSTQAVVRVAAAAAAAHLPAEHSEPVLLQLVDDADPGVQKLAMRSAPAAMSDALRARVTTLKAAFASPATKVKPRKTAKPRKAAKRRKTARPRKTAKSAKKARRNRG
jgi:hypothetical protein